MRLIFEQIRSGGDRNFGYLLGDREARAAVLIDPSYSPDVFIERARAHSLSITHVIKTPSHPEHTNGNERALAVTRAAFAAHPTLRPSVPLEDGATLNIGELRLIAHHVPGHCPDHLVLYESVHRLLITGDLLFVGKVGGTEDDDDARTEWRSLQRVLTLVPDETTVWPGHDYGVRPSSTINLEKQTNPFLLCTDEAAFLRLKAEWSQVKQRLGLK
jgi:glyoxylase-like metal-dependent hydrolase (beta-lactamase superfamily II)